MKILFLTDEFFPDFGANSLVIKSLCEELVVQGYEPYVMPFNYKRELMKEQEWDKIHIIRGVKIENKDLMLDEIKKGHIKDAMLMAFNAMYLKKINREDFRAKGRIYARRYIEKYILEHKIDVVISICCSIELSLPLLYLREKGRLSCRWIMYMIDPFESHIYYRKHFNEQLLRKWQHRLMMACDKVVSTDLIYEDMKKWETEDVLQKTITTGFPKIQKKKFEKQIQKNIELFSYNINIVCTGTRNEIERNSEFTLKMCKAVKNEKVKFYFVGPGWTDNEIKIDGNIIFCPPCSWQEANNLQLQADFLLNIGNKVVNQLPSKILEYISTGKPIINICKAKECPTIKLLESYDSLVIYEGETSQEVAVRKLESYIGQNHQPEEFSEIEKKYQYFTPAFVCKEFFSGLM